MNLQVVRTLVVKDITLFFRNRFFALVSGLGVVAYAAIFFLMPSTVDEELAIALYAPSLPPIFAELTEQEGLVVETMDSEEALKQAMLDGDFGVGVVLPPGMVGKLAAGERERIQLYLTPDFPRELEEAYVILFQELAFVMTGQPIPVEVSQEILGPDMAGMQIPPRARMLPLFAVMLLMVESMGLASLIVSEVEGGTLEALLITPMGVGDLFLGKGITGVGLAFVQVTALMAATGGLRDEPLLVLCTLLLGSLLVTGVGFLIGSAGRDMMSVMALGVPSVIILAIPSFGILFPGSISDWIKMIPSYYLVDTVHRVTNFGAGWSDVWANLAVLLGFDLLLVALGIAALRRKVR
jgi:ABC-2 type transport system permease protein